MNDAIRQLINLGLSQNEARCYIELLKESPSNPYRISKTAGIPTSKVYEVFSKLVEKGLVAEIEGSERGYVPKDPETAMEEWRARYARETAAAAASLKTVAAKQKHHIVWNFDGREEVISRGIDLISSGEKTICFAASAGFAEEWGEAVDSAIARGVVVKAVRLEIDDASNGGLSGAMNRTGAVLVVDERAVFFASATADLNTLHGAWTENKAIVDMALGFVENRVFIDMMIDNHWVRWGDTE